MTFFLANVAQIVGNFWAILKKNYLYTKTAAARVVAQLVERSLSITEVRGSTPVIGKIKEKKTAAATKHQIFLSQA